MRSDSHSQNEGTTKEKDYVLWWILSQVESPFNGRRNLFDDLVSQDHTFFDELEVSSLRFPQKRYIMA